MKTTTPKLHSIKLKGRDNVEVLDVATRLDVDPQQILMAAINARMQCVVIVGYDCDGREYFASSMADGGDALWHLQRASKRLLDLPDD